MVDVTTGSTGGSITVTGGSQISSITATSDTTQYWSNQSKSWAEKSEASAKKAEQAKEEVITQKDTIIGEVTAEGEKQKGILETTAQSYVDEAKNWANKIGDTVDGVEYSAKHYAELAADRAETAITDIQAQEDLSLSVINDLATTTKTEIQTEGATQVNNIKQTGFYMQDGKLYYVDNEGNTQEFKSGGGGLEVGDIGMALYIDETKGLRRYLNGQIVAINTNTQGFLDWLLKIKTLSPSLFTTEGNWQAEKTLSDFGQVGKFVLNYAADGVTVESVRFPAVVNVQGLFDLQNLGMTVKAGLPDITGDVNLVGSGNVGLYMNTSGAFSREKGTAASNQQVASASGGNPYALLKFAASSSNPVYSSSNTVQQEAIQYPYFIQIATGSETEVIVNNQLETNVPYVYGQSQYIPYKLSDIDQANMSLLISEGQENPKGTYPDYYDWILKNVNNGVEGFKLSTSTDITDYDFVINTENETFRLPLLNGEERKIDYKNGVPITSNHYIAPANGIVTFWCTNAPAGSSEIRVNNQTPVQIYLPNLNMDRAQWVDVSRNDIVDFSGVGGTQVKTFYPARGNGSLYYYVGETVQNANLIDAGRLAEGLATKTNAAQAAHAAMPSGRAVELTVGASGAEYKMPADGVLVVQANQNSDRFGTVNLVDLNQWQLNLYSVLHGTGPNGSYTSMSRMVKKDTVIQITYANANLKNVYFIYAEGSKGEQ